LEHRLVRTRDLVDAIDRAHFDTGFAPGAIIRPDDGQFLGQLLTRLTGGLRHGRSSCYGNRATIFYDTILPQKRPAPRLSAHPRSTSPVGPHCPCRCTSYRPPARATS